MQKGSTYTVKNMVLSHNLAGLIGQSHKNQWQLKEEFFFVVMSQNCSMNGADDNEFWLLVVQHYSNMCTVPLLQSFCRSTAVTWLLHSVFFCFFSPFANGHKNKVLCNPRLTQLRKWKLYSDTPNTRKIDENGKTDVKTCQHKDIVTKEIIIVKITFNIF